MAKRFFPGPHDWECCSPSEVGMDQDKIRDAVEFARASESDGPRDIGFAKRNYGDEPYRELIGPVKERGGTNGLILRNGRIVAEWGDTNRVDMTFSVTKSFVSATAGLAYDRGLIRDVHDKVGDYVHDGGFESSHNSKITWHHLLNQTSDWEGTLWGKPDWADRPEGEPHPWLPRERPEPGTIWKYNDVRVNRLALSLLRIWREPLPKVLRENLMEPIGASRTWEWHGYENSWVTIDGVRMQSVSGGAHWGGGMWINTRDLARFGYLCLNQGRWENRQILSEQWIKMSSSPVAEENYCSQEPRWSGNATDSVSSKQQVSYGYMNWFLNTRRHLLPSAPDSSFYHAGAGSNLIWIDPESDLVVVVRWFNKDRLDELIKRVLASME